MVSKLAEWNLINTWVLLRADLNVPLKDGNILDDTRLQALCFTLDLILQKGGRCIIMTHIGEPTQYDAALSTKHLMPWFSQRDYRIQFAAKPADINRYTDAHIILLENVRFFPGEKSKDPAFAQDLALLGDYYVDDAFGTLHRTDTSITLVPLLFAPDKRTIGLLVEKELHVLSRLRTHPEHPFVLVLGGGKAATKIPLIEALLTIIDTLLLCPALAFTFAQALGKPVGKSLVDDSMLAACHAIIEKSKHQNVEIVLPIDYQIAYDTITKPFAIVDADAMPDNGIGISVGPKTIELFKKKMENAKTIFCNGIPGFPEQPETLDGAKNLLHAITSTSATTVISGGDSIAVAHSFGLTHAFTHVSTGGGSTLTYLSGQPLPGLEVFNELGRMQEDSDH